MKKKKKKRMNDKARQPTHPFSWKSNQIEINVIQKSTLKQNNY